ncbi:MAG: SPOR domain-containing protein [Spirochaetales bacterium]|nr:SPOR domain-containing protein [Spirochaetales bacterium]
MKNEKSILIMLAVGLSIFAFAIVGIVVVTGNSNQRSSETISAVTGIDITPGSNSNTSQPLVQRESDVNDAVADPADAVDVVGNQEDSLVENSIAIKEDKSFGTPREHYLEKEPVPLVENKPAQKVEATPQTKKPSPAVVKPQTTAKSQTPAVSKPQTLFVDEYWVQIASFSQQTRATAIREEMVEKGYTCLITTRESGGNTFFRVRIGPFYSKQEADQAANLFKKDSRFENSYVAAPIKVERIK